MDLRAGDRLLLVQRFMTCASFAAFALVAACADPPPAKMAPNKPDDGVAANSASEERLNKDTKPKTAPTTSEDPTQPLMTPMTGGEVAPTTKGAPAKPATTKEPKGGGGKVSKAECKQLFDKYIDLAVGSDSRFEGIPPEMIAQLKASARSQAQSEQGDPCNSQEVSRTQFNCAIAAPTTAAWQRCMK